MEESVERFALDEGFQSPLVQAQSTQDVGERGNDFACWWNLYYNLVSSKNTIEQKL